MSIDLDRGSGRALAVQVEARPRPRHRAGQPTGRSVAGPLALTAALVVTAISVAASAATLGGVNGGSLFTQILPGPSQGVLDTFTGVGGSTLSGRVTDTGQIWTVSGGAFALNGAGTAAQSGANNALSTAWVPTALTSYTAKFDLTRVNSQADSGGLYLNVDAAGTSGIAVLWQPGTSNTGQIVLGKITGGSTITVLDTHPNAGVPAPGTAVTLTVVSNGSGSYTISFGAFGPYPVTLSAADTTTFAANTNAGLVSDHNNKNLYDNFSVQP